MSLLQLTSDPKWNYELLVTYMIQLLDDVDNFKNTGQVIQDVKT